MDFNDKLLFVRAKLNITQSELSRKMGVSNATINRWETNKVKPTKKAKLRFEIFCNENNIIFKEFDRV